MFYTAQAYAAERNADAADAEYMQPDHALSQLAARADGDVQGGCSCRPPRKTACRRRTRDIIVGFAPDEAALLADERLQSAVRGRGMSEAPGHEMPFLDHLEELRKRLWSLAPLS